MIFSFPDPYPDELLYSAFARYTERMGITSTRRAAQHLLGDEEATAVHDLPSRLQHLLDSLPKGHVYTLDYLIDNHTLFPYYAPFHPADQIVLARSLMASTGSNRLNAILGKSSASIKRPDALRYCPVCVAEERATPGIGEPYWHRIHQIPGVLVCPEHQVRLEKSTAQLREGDPRRFILTESAIRDCSPQLLDFDDPQGMALFYIAQDSHWLLNHAGLAIDLIWLTEKYLAEVESLGLKTENGRVKRSELTKAIIDYFTEGFLAQLGCTITDTLNSWPIRVLGANGNPIPRQPLYHILMAHFLGSMFSAFIEGSTTE